MSCETQKGAHTSVGLVSAEQRGAVAKMVGNVPFPDTVRFSPGNKEWENITLLCAECALLVGGGLRADWEGCVSWPLPGGQEWSAGVALSAEVERGCTRCT